MEPRVVEVKGILQQGLSLFGHMMHTVDTLEPGQSLIVKSTFDPKPLIAHMRRKGYAVHQEQVGKMKVTTFDPQADGGQPDGKPRTQSIPIEGPEHFLDNRGLVPPEPMQKTLALLDAVPPGHVVVIHNDRVPVFLLSELDDEQYPYEIQAQPDHSAIVRILKPPPSEVPEVNGQH